MFEQRVKVFTFTVCWSCGLF